MSTPTPEEIFREEVKKLKSQINDVDVTISSKNRVLALNESYSKKMSSYTRLILAIVFALAIAVLLNILKSKFAIIPGAVVTVSYILLFSASLIYAMFVVSDVYSRDNTDFDKLDLDPPSGVINNIQNKVISQRKSERSDFDLLPGFCIGQNCCTTGMAWDDENSKCVTSCPNAGYYKDIETSTCTRCGAGTYAGLGAASCSSCPSTTPNSPAGSISIASCTA
jgi:uncharacterized membrane protein (DUF485 family)